VAGHKINLKKSITFLFTNNEQIVKEYRKTIYNSFKKNQIAKNNLNKGYE
jgi:hypothetical protein